MFSKYAIAVSSLVINHNVVVIGTVAITTALSLSINHVLCDLKGKNKLRSTYSGIWPMKAKGIFAKMWGKNQCRVKRLFCDLL